MPHRALSAVVLTVVVATIAVVFALDESRTRAGGTTFTVETTDDGIDPDGDCSLREAVNSARLNDAAHATAIADCGTGSAASMDTIVLAAGMNYALDAGPDPEQGDLQLAEIGSGQLTITCEPNCSIFTDTYATITGSGTERVMATAAMSDTVILEYLYLTGGGGTAVSGGAINNAGSMQLYEVSIVGNTPAGSSLGGGIFNSGTMEVYDSYIAGNDALGAGKGIYNASSGDLDLVRSYVHQNGTTTAGSGGGIRWLGTGSIVQSAIVGNLANTGAAILTSSPLVIANSTISGNNSNAGGAAIYLDNAALTLTNVTITDNTSNVSDNVIFVFRASAILTVENSIIAGNNSQDCLISLTMPGTITSNGHNIESGTSCGFTSAGDIQNGNADLEPLDTDGTIAPAHPLGPFSDAYDAGDNAACAASPVNNEDQWGNVRPVDGDNSGGAQCDIGALEMEQGTAATPSPTPEPTNTPAPTATPSPTATATPEPTGTATATAGPTGTATPTPTATAEPTPLPSGVTPAPTATPTPTPTSGPSETPGAKRLQGDVQCDGDVDSVDALQQLRDVASLETFQEDGCPAIGVAGAVFGDVDCDGDVDSVDALKVLRHVAALSVPQMEPCTDIGEPL